MSAGMMGEPIAKVNWFLVTCPDCFHQWDYVTVDSPSANRCRPCQRRYDQARLAMLAISRVMLWVWIALQNQEQPDYCAEMFVTDAIAAGRLRLTWPEGS